MHTENRSLLVPTKLADLLKAFHALRQSKRRNRGEVLVQASAICRKHHFSRRLTDVPEAVIATTKGVLSLASVERDPRLAIEELELAVDHREDFALSKVTMRRGPAWGRGLQASHKSIIRRATRRKDLDWLAKYVDDCSVFLFISPTLLSSKPADKVEIEPG